MTRKNRRVTEQKPKKRRGQGFTKFAVAETSGACLSGKIRYGDERNAWLALRSAQRHRMADGEEGERRYYICMPPLGVANDGRYCGGYHLTSMLLIGE